MAKPRTGMRTDGRTETGPDGPELARLTPRLQGFARGLLSRWVGRFAVRTAAACGRVELFDRSMAVAAQVFTSVFPILILVSSWTHPDSNAVTESLGLPDETRAVMDEAMGGTSTTTTTVGVI